jgi:hypothetical protein
MYLRKTFSLPKMIKSFVTGAAVIAVSALAPLSAIAGPFYFNPEANVGAGEDGVTGATVDLHLGVKNEGFFAQIGPMVQVPDTGDTEVGVSGKAGYSFGAGYSELSFASIDSDTSFNLKVGKTFDL